LSTAGLRRAVLLDALGTLVALEPPAPLLRAELARRFAVELTEADAKRAIAAEIAYYRAHLGEGSDPERLAALRRKCAQALHRALPESARAALTDTDALTAALLASLRFRAFEDVAPALAALRGQGLALVVVSNWDVSLHWVLQDVGLGSAIDRVLSSAEAGARKPSPAIFEQALLLAGVPASGAIHVGDSLEEDVAGARAAGIEPVLLRRDGSPGPPGLRTVASLAELAG
jgi:putative hydrolase of the HAD superfamily